MFFFFGFFFLDTKSRAMPGSCDSSKPVFMTPGQPSPSEQEKSASVRALIRGECRHLTLLNHERVLSGGSAAGGELDGALLSQGTFGRKG